ncbi:uncharacterized protein [Diadema antillarum]|uniref:uncharacterized protein n=1 Tax=Diadema antillarum TaxID=105358 RepID=UPI003A83E160
MTPSLQDWYSYTILLILHLAPTVGSRKVSTCQLVLQAVKKQALKQGQQLCNMKILNVNFQSLRNKKEELAVLIESNEASIIIGTKTWLNSSVYTSEIFPPNYNVVRKDRQDGCGGVLIAVRRDLVYNIIKVCDEGEQVYIKLSFGKGVSLVVGAVYRPPGNDVQYLDNVCSTIEELSLQNKKAVLWIGGDFNLPDINWEDLSVSGHSNPVPLNNRFLDMIENCNTQQMVSSPTRRDSILDLFLTNRPSLINKCTLLPGLGDHDIVSIDSDVSAKRCKPLKRKIYLWEKANLSDMKRDCRQFQRDFLSKYCEQSSVHEMWITFKTSLLNMLDTHASLTQGDVPEDWKKADVVPIFKKGERYCLQNFGTHCLQQYFRSPWLDNHQILSETQHGFRKRRSCTSQLLLTIHDLSSGIDSRNQIDVILFDLSKAFDMVPHGRLLHKIQFYGIRGNTHNWIKEFLTGRSQRVVLDGCTSHTSSVPSGVPQGSVIGPLLFLLDPSSQENIRKLEMVQRRCARFVLGDYHRDSSVTAMLNKLQWSTLQERRAQQRVYMMYSILNGLVDLPVTYFIPVAGPSKRGNPHKLQVPFARTHLFQSTFYPDAIRLWNSLPPSRSRCNL